MLSSVDLLLAFVILGPILWEGAAWLARRRAATPGELRRFQPAAYTFSASAEIAPDKTTHLHFAPPSTPNRNTHAITSITRDFGGNEVSSGIRPTLRPIKTEPSFTYSRSAHEDIHGVDVASDHGVKLPFRDSRICVKGKTPALDIIVNWWESKSPFKILAPPDLSESNDVLELGDVYVHRAPGHEQLWVRIPAEGSDGGWKPVTQGHIRGDGRVLTLMEGRKLPSWLERSWFMKRLHQNRV
ncbi:uncharacterized protein TRAVEDRAFT_48927 [Trametes versicolor FP-101664 SS1]|uniref:uncharacterized protein n=1 Tax=Trametes versicolor (strain FP-101664) TaxID=717944 RepID=UPI00046239D2|nr:uncharacterized protein TRAVEDRAFT_48927 [Trametes versicolor FP-101664 SS1]EIW57905.1 hypothetical protein TRAVEDRAFT_48927 [Trametes versicolor FP-101664 SS1]